MIGTKANKILCIVFIVTILTTQAQTDYKADVHLVLLAGQSNMVGAGNYDELSSVDKKRIENISDRVFLSYNGKALKPLSYFNNKPSKKYNFTKRFGPELFIGLTLAEANPNQKYVLVKRALGGTSLYGAWSPEWSAEKSNAVEMDAQRKKIKLYELHLKDIHKTLEQLKSQGKSFKIIGLTWMQGEKDTNSELAAKNYRENLENLINHYRKDLNTSKLPFIIGQVNVLPRKYKPGVDFIRNAQIEVGSLDERNTMIKTSKESPWNDFPKHLDNTHYNTIGQKRLGEAFAKSLIEKIKLN
ncbi:sialate O-acetylesterase [Seonamhaeicola marinus]|nr:sialate O-acetylesterase [Seonamhaeicola marinus]